MTGPQVIQYNLIRFDTSSADRSLTLPGAAGIVSALGVPKGSFTAIAVTADGSHNVNIIGGTNVTVKPSASQVAANTTRTLFLILDNISSGSQAVTVY
jgi:hypothetical protein